MGLVLTASLSKTKKLSLTGTVFLLLYFSGCVNDSSEPQLLPIEEKIDIEVSEGYDYDDISPPSNIHKAVLAHSNYFYYYLNIEFV